MRKAVLLAVAALVVGCTAVRPAPVPQAQTQQHSTPDVEQMVRSVPLVVYEGAVGAGVLFRNGDKVGMVSAAHIFEDPPVNGLSTYGAKRVSVVGYAPGTESVDWIQSARVVFVQPEEDWIVLELESAHPSMRFASFSDRLPTIGADVWCVGSPLMDAGTVTRGIVSHPDRKPSISPNPKIRYIHSDAVGTEGNSGGGMFGADGVCYGIVVRKNALNSTSYAFSTRYIHEGIRGSLLPVQPLPPFIE